MKRQISLSFIFIFSCFFIFTGCKKESNTPTPPKTKTELITQSQWKYSSATVGGAPVDMLIQSCQKDNTMIFQVSGNGTLDEGATKCNSSDPQNVPFTWSFNTGETVLNVSAILFTGGSTTFNLVSLSSTQLVLSQNITIGGNSQTAIVTFIH